MKQHFVTFLSPGTFVHEETTKPIDSWDIDKAVQMSKTITERYGARPFAFQFSTRERNSKQLDSQMTKVSGLYFLGGKIMTLQQVKETMPKEKILIENMERNKILKIVVNDNSWRTAHPLSHEDIVLPLPPPSAKSPHPARA